MRQALAIQHVAFEDLGTLEPALLTAGYSIELRQAGVDDLSSIDLQPPDLLIVLGGPIGVYEQEVYPYLRDEIALLARRLARGRPTLGICLGAQLMAAALGAEVMPGTAGKEIGWSGLTAAPVTTNPLAPLFEPGVEVLHWHGDTFGLPQQATLLASTSRYAHQAFSIGDHALALQFHAEVKAARLERWYIGHAAELGAARIGISGLRQQARRSGAMLEHSAATLWDSWLRAIGE
jgi:GMP synthase (glutamine-hydrolysing)